MVPSRTLILIGGVILSACQGHPQSDSPQQTTTALTAEQVAQALDLEQHLEGGYFRRTYEADHRPMLESPEGERYLMTSIFYMLTDQSPVGHFHLNQSDILHYYHRGDPVRYYLIHPDGHLETIVLGQNIAQGQRLQLTVKGGIWKASQLLDGEAGYGLISEAVSPGFDYADMTLGTEQKLTDTFPQHSELFKTLTRE